MQFRVIMVTNPQTGPITIHCAIASTQCNYNHSCFSISDDAIAINYYVIVDATFCFQSFDSVGLTSSHQLITFPLSALPTNM